MEMKKVGAPALELSVVNRLLDMLSTDDAFRALFETDTQAALEAVGYVHPDPLVAHPGICLHTDRLASKESIAAQRPKLLRTLNAIVNFACPQELQSV
jgi:putative modified peptide